MTERKAAEEIIISFQHSLIRQLGSFSMYFTLSKRVTRTKSILVKATSQSSPTPVNIQIRYIDSQLKVL